MKLPQLRRPQRTAERLRLLVAGNAQANVIADVLERMPSMRERFDIFYLGINELTASISCDVLLLQTGEPKNVASADYADAKTIIRFPRLYFGLMWPLSCVNPYNEPEPPEFPHGRFPYGDSYVANCVERHVPSEDILSFCGSSIWPASWPDLDRLFRAESARLAALDGVCDVKLASFILKRFAQRQLFASPNSPSNSLLAELIARIVQQLVIKEEIDAISQEIAHGFAQYGNRDVLGSIEVPIHPAVASHFGLSWYSKDAAYRYFGETLAYDEYFQRLIAQSYAAESTQRISLKESQPVLLVYGNCQAEAVASIMKHSASLPYRVLYLRSFDEPGSRPMELSREQVAPCTLLWEQHDTTRPFPYREWLSDSCKVVTFPAVDFNVLWPFTCVNRYAHPKPPEHPFGVFPYGDRIIAESVEKGLGPEAIFAHYTNEWESYKPDLDRLLEIEVARLTARDAKCDVKMAEFVLQRFREARLFWTVNHPTSALLSELVERLVAASSAAQPGISAIDPAAILRAHFGEHGPLGVSSIPIHPEVGKHYQLRWYDTEMEKFQSWNGVTYTYDDYVRSLISDSLSARASLGSTQTAEEV